MSTLVMRSGLTILPSRRIRALASALYGGVGGTVFALVAGFADVVLIRDLPLYVDWAGFLSIWALAGLGLAALGALTAWPRAGWRGILMGSFGLAGVVLGVSLIQAQVWVPAGVVVLLLTLVPLAVVCAPLALLLRWLGERHWRAVDYARPDLRQQVALLLALAAGLGLLTGSFLRLSPRAERAAREVDRRLQLQAVDQLPVPPVARPAFSAHLGRPYTLRVRPSRLSAEGYDLAVIYPDGYTLTCVVVVYPGRDPYLRSCADGEAPAPAPALR
jgi:hypothetical protein